MSPLKIGIPLNFHLLLHLFFNHLNLKQSWFLWSWFMMILEVHALSQTLLYNTTTNHSIQYSSLISLLHSLYSHRSDNSIVSATQNLCRHQRRIKTHKIYIRGIITPYVSSTVILFHLQRAGFVSHYKILVQQHPPQNRMCCGTSNNLKIKHLVLNSTQTLRKNYKISQDKLPIVNLKLQHNIPHIY